MSDYQRFISYLYAYKNNQKSQNCGFLKAESRNGHFKLEVHIKDISLPLDTPVEIYGYQQSLPPLSKILLGSTKSSKEAIHYHIESPCTLQKEPTLSFSDLEGVFLLCNKTFSYASAWNDVPIVPQDLILSEKPTLTAEEIPNSSVIDLSQYESYHPFSDDDISECFKIDIKDFPSLRQNSWLIASNPFIAYAYHEHQHLLLGHIDSPTQNFYFLGVPGTYHPKEKFMAQMYGFPYFRACTHQSQEHLLFGYWYRILS